MSNNSENIIRIIACAVFKPALDYLRLEERHPNVRLTYVPSYLHLRPQELKSRLEEKIVSAKEGNERVVCLYGECFPGINELCQQLGAIKVPGDYCYEMLLGSERFHQLIQEMAGTYFAEKDLITHFQEYCVRPLDLQDEEMRKYCFDRYRRLLYIRQPSDPNLISRAGEMADFLELSLDVRDADYSHLDRVLVELI